MKEIIEAIIMFLKERFDFTHELEDHQLIISNIEKGVFFKGINVWALIFAILIASVGLNMNSTAVIIGAMLISPLMGPIMGVGLSIGINDIELLKNSIKNISIAVIISIITASIYFEITPLSIVQSELLARTNPTIYDVLIALFGGLIGTITGVTKEKGNALAGVAIATALMPPLCTAGFGLASGVWSYFFGAIYLFFINAVMISLSTFMVVRFLQFPLKQIVDKSRAKRVKTYIYTIVIVTVLPSIYSAYLIVEKTIYENKANQFLSKEFNFEKTQILNKKIKYHDIDKNRIEVLLAGEVLDPKMIAIIKNRIGNYSLPNTELIIKQGVANLEKIDINQIRSEVLEEIYNKNEIIIRDKDKKISLLEEELSQLKANFYPTHEIGEEINAINNSIIRTAAIKTTIHDVILKKDIETIIVFLVSKEKLRTDHLKILHDWLLQRLKLNKNFQNQLILLTKLEKEL